MKELKLVPNIVFDTDITITVEDRTYERRYTEKFCKLKTCLKTIPVRFTEDIYGNLMPEINNTYKRRNFCCTDHVNISKRAARKLNIENNKKIIAVKISNNEAIMNQFLYGK